MINEKSFGTCEFLCGDMCSIQEVVLAPRTEHVGYDPRINV